MNALNLANETLIQPTSTAGTSFFASILLLLMGLIIGTIASKFLRRIFIDIRLNAFVQQGLGFRIRADAIIANVVGWTIYGITIYSFLSRLGIAHILIIIISIIVITYLIVWFVFSAKDFIDNISSGFKIRRRTKLHFGNTITINQTRGIIESVGLTELELKNTTGDVLAIPYKHIAHSTLKLLKQRRNIPNLRPNKPL